MKGKGLGDILEQSKTLPCTDTIISIMLMLPQIGFFQLEEVFCSGTSDTEKRWNICKTFAS